MTQTFAESINAFLERHGIETKPPTVYTGAEARVIPAGARNQTLTAIAGLLRKTGMAPNLIAAAVNGIATDPDSIESTDWDDGELERIVANIGQRGSEAFDTGSYSVETLDIDRANVPPLKWVIEGFLPAEGLTLLFGLPANGKSYVAMDVCVACLSGRPTWINGGKITKLRRVGYLDWERRGGMFRRRMKALSQGQGVVIDYVTCKRPLSEMIDEMRELALTRGWELIIIDSLSIAIMNGDLMAANEVIPRMFALHEMGIPILMLDHMAKPQNGGNPSYASAYGSMFKEAIVSMAWHATKADPYGRKTPGYMDLRLMQKKQNFDTPSEDIDAHLDLELDEASGALKRVELVTGYKNEFPPDFQIIEALRHRVEMTRDEIAQATGMNADTVYRYLKKPEGLIEQGAVIISSPGGHGAGNAEKYALLKLPDSERPTD